MELIFTVQGSAAEPYQVRFARSGLAITATCTCPAGDARQQCKHRVRLMEGVVDGLINASPSDLAMLSEALTDSDLMAALVRMRAAEKEVEEAKDRLSDAKHALSRIMHGG